MDDKYLLDESLREAVQLLIALEDQYQKLSYDPNHKMDDTMDKIHSYYFYNRQHNPNQEIKDLINNRLN